jgi:hypothetical protein
MAAFWKLRLANFNSLIEGTGAFTCDVIDEDLETTLGLLHLLDGDVNLDLLREDEEIVHELDERFMN